MRCLILFVVAALTIGVTWGPAEGQTKNKSGPPQQPSDTKSSDSNKFQRGSKDSPIFVHIEQDQQSQTQTTKTESATTDKEFYDKLVAYSAASAAVFTLALVIVGWCGVSAANRTLKAIERQVTLQAASMTQWVSVSKWAVNVTQTVGPLSPQPRVLSIEFAIENESSFPLIMQATFRFFGRLPNGTNVHTGGDANLFPRKPYPMRIPILRLTEDQGEEYMGHGLRIAVHGQIIHVGVAKEQSPLMTIRGNLLCGRGVATPYLENESIRLIPIDPVRKKGLIERLRLWWKRAPEEPSQDENPS